MKPVIPSVVQEVMDSFAGQHVYIHLETTNGAYATHSGGSSYSAGAFIRNALVQFEHGKITGNGPYRIGLKMPIGWVYAEGINHYQIDSKNRLLLAGLDDTGKLAVALEISKTPFE